MPIISPFKPIKFEVTTASGIKISYNLLDKLNLKKFGFSLSDIREVEPIFEFPGYPYEEEGVASKDHPLIGSACASFNSYDSRRYSIDDIWYFDKNIKQDHFNGRPHWNHERRFVEHSSEGAKIIGRTKKVEGHIIPAYPFLDISLDPGPRGTKVKKKVFRP